MPIVSCKICEKEFYAKPNWLEKGWGKFCSRECQYKGQRNGKFVYCNRCGVKIWRTPKDYKNSKSGKFFCTKSCQTLWRNKLYSGPRHPLWKGGEGLYRQVLAKSGSLIACRACGNKNEKVLVAHHKDMNRKNKNLENLEWLCRNCHFLIHHYPDLL